MSLGKALLPHSVIGSWLGSRIAKDDIRFWNSPDLPQADDFCHSMRETFDGLYAEAARGPRMMSIGLHPRMIGRPGRIRSLTRFFDHAAQYCDAWFAAREEIVRAWLTRTAASGSG